MCRALIARGHEVCIATTRDGLSRVNGNGNGPHLYNGTSIHFFPVQWGDGFKYSRPMKTWLDENVRSFDVVHIHAVFNHSSVAAAHVCQKARVPYVVRPLGTLDPWSMTQKSLRKRLFWQISGKGIMDHAAAVHYTSEAEKLSTESSLGLNHGRVIPLGVETAVSNGRVDQDPYVLVLSRLHPKKGLDVLIDAFLSLVQMPQFAEWRLVLAGDGPSEYVSMLKAKAADDRIKFTGWLDGEEKNSVLSGASLLVLPSHQENFGLCVMEALAHSVPVLVSPNVNLAPEIAAAHAGWIASTDKTALKEKLAEALLDRDELTRRGRAGLQFARKYSWENSARELADLYRSVYVHRV